MFVLFTLPLVFHGVGGVFPHIGSPYLGGEPPPIDPFHCYPRNKDAQLPPPHSLRPLMFIYLIFHPQFCFANQFYLEFK
jgi:hypothetical protein